MGPFTVNLLLGGPIIAGATLSRFFALHVFVIPGSLLALVGLHLLLVLKLGINEWPMPGRLVRRATYVKEYHELKHKDGIPFVPGAITKDMFFSGFIVLSFPHVMAIACMYREDYARAGYLAIPVYVRNLYLLVDFRKQEGDIMDNIDNSEVKFIRRNVFGLGTAGLAAAALTMVGERKADSGSHFRGPEDFDERLYVNRQIERLIYDHTKSMAYRRRGRPDAGRIWRRLRVERVPHSLVAGSRLDHFRSHGRV
jgi:hypothetical protein